LPLLSTLKLFNSVFVLFFRVCNTFMNFPSVFSIDASSTVKKKKKKKRLLLRRGRLIIATNHRQSRGEALFECRLKGRKISPNFKPMKWQQREKKTTLTK
uniref:Uncharacterized protein n=1 Tax=Castor canadensis TaxID=51338 RepID=A0A8C0XUQ3_CASCN